jgi:hypothetical protein
MMLKPAQIKNTLKVMTGGADGWRSVGPTVSKVKQYYIKSRKKETSYIQ